MSLDWNTKECPGNGVTSGWVPVKEEDLDPGTKSEKIIHVDTNTLVWGAFCGIHLGSITIKNIDEWIWRIEYLKLISRPWMRHGEFPAPEAVDQHLGLWTNCDTKTRRQWLAFQTKCLSDDVTRTIDNQCTSQEAGSSFSDSPAPVQSVG